MQYNFNESVNDRVEGALSALARNNLETVKAELEEGKTLIEKRQKLNKIADRSNYGWQTVNEYLSDDLASDSADEKRFSKAEKNAEKKIQIKKKAYRAKKAYKMASSSRLQCC